MFICITTCAQHDRFPCRAHRVMCSDHDAAAVLEITDCIYFFVVCLYFFPASYASLYHAHKAAFSLLRLTGAKKLNDAHA